MKLDKVLENLNSFEKNNFLKIVDAIISNTPKNSKQIDEILSGSNDLKNIDNVNISRVFDLVNTEFESFVRNEFVNTGSQLDILIDIISREGNAIMRLDWFSRLYDQKLDELKGKLQIFKDQIFVEEIKLEEHSRIRDYKIYYSCLKTAYQNDEDNNQQAKITQDELSILLTLAKKLELSQDEVKMINYFIIPIQKHKIDDIINELKGIGVIFYSKKHNLIYVADEVAAVLRKVRGQEVAPKYFRRVLRLIKESQINLVCRKHGIDKKLPVEDKIKAIVNSGISFSALLMDEIHKADTNLTDKKKFLNELFEKGLGQSDSLKGTLLDEKVENFIAFFNELEKEEKVGISIEGYDKLLLDLNTELPTFQKTVQLEYQFQEDDCLQSKFLLDFNIKPRDLLELLSSSDLTLFVKNKGIKSRGDLFVNILENYRDSENLLLENYHLIANRNLNDLKANGIEVKEADLGLKFEELTKEIFTQLGFQVDEKLKETLNSNKDKIDILVKLTEDEVILVECKTSKESGFNKFSSVSRQLKSYEKRVTSKGLKVVKSLLVAPEFSDDFVKECGLDYDLNLSLLSANCLYGILNAFKESKLSKFPHNLLMRDVVIQEERIIKALEK
ncbi:MAG: restriction endonuclease [Schleiferiaceae bacterium]|nr:restriction endonuclease [Schleiferiaceae bacterium]